MPFIKDIRKWVEIQRRQHSHRRDSHRRLSTRSNTPNPQLPQRYPSLNYTICLSDCMNFNFVKENSCSWQKNDQEWSENCHLSFTNFEDNNIYRIFSYSFRGHYPFLNFEILSNSNSWSNISCRNYEEIRTI